METSEIYILTGHSEKEFVEMVDGVMNYIAPIFEFGYYAMADIRQEGHIFALNLIRKGQYDRSKKLSNYLFRHITNRMHNLQRNVTKRYNKVAMALINPIHFSSCEDNIELFLEEEVQYYTNEDLVVDETSRNEITQLINANLPANLRGVFLKMMADIKVGRVEREKVQGAIYEIIKDSGHFENLLDGLNYGGI